MHRIRLCPMVLMLLVAGCAGSMGTIHADPAPSSVTAFDGSYRSTIRLTGTADVAKGTNWCDTPGQPIITVSNGLLSYTVPHPNVSDEMTPTFEATIAEDGTFSGQVVGGTMSGTVSGTHMEGRIDGQACLYAFSADRI